MFKGHQANFDESPHRAGSSACSYFCKIACRCFRPSKIPKSRMGRELEMASSDKKSKYYSLK